MFTHDFNYNYEDFTEFDMSPGTHSVLPRLREVNPDINLSLALQALRTRASVRGLFVKINKLNFTGYADKEAKINYTLIGQDEILNLINNQDPLAYEFY